VNGLTLRGGGGSRLRPLTDASARSRTRLASTARLFAGIGTTAAAGVSVLGIVVGDTHEETRRAAGDGPQRNFHVTDYPRDSVCDPARAAAISHPSIGTRRSRQHCETGSSTAIMNDDEVRDAGVGHVPVLRGKRDHDIGTRIEDSLIGTDPRRRRVPARLLACRLTVGGRSEVRVRW